jgi:hypothetical protein
LPKGILTPSFIEIGPAVTKRALLTDDDGRHVITIAHQRRGKKLPYLKCIPNDEVCWGINIWWQFSKDIFFRSYFIIWLSLNIRQDRGQDQGQKSEMETSSYKAANQ